MSEEEERGELFTCKKCGSHELYFEQFYNYTTEIVEWLPCGSTDEPAVEITVIITGSTREYGDMDLDPGSNDFHRVVNVKSEPGGDEPEREIVDTIVRCEKCYEEADESDWETEQQGEPEGIEETNECYVKCVGCDREIEFGWSHPDHGGRVWPSECRDFNPWKSWPEPRYVESWRARAG
jgi:DNA-directed RNA polymerase subunit M/transcription elongation factor TFIIS